MNILKDTTLKSNPYLKINFDGGDLSSDAGLLMIKEFAEKLVLSILYTVCLRQTIQLRLGYTQIRRIFSR